jgi:hypothetical protein
MNTKTLGALCARKMQIEYTRTRKDLAKRLKRRQTPEAVKSIINESSILLNDKLSVILTLYIAKAFKGGKQDAESELKDAIRAAAPRPDIIDPLVGKITHRNIGAIGKYNLTLNNALQKEYNTLLSNNKLANSLKRDGWTPWMGETLKKRRIDPKVISLIKQQSTSAKMVTILNQQGIRGGLHPDQIGRRLEPFVNRYYGSGGVEIDNVGKSVKQLRIDADGNYKWVNHKVTRKYRATSRTYSRLVARNAMKTAHQEAYYQSLQKTNLVDHFISVSVLDSRTCGDCAMMHGRTVLKSEGPPYHGNCHCDLKPVWKEDGLLGDKNRDDSFYINQRDRHFLAVDDLKRYNMHLPTGSKLKHYTMLPKGARTTIMPGPIKMRAIRNRLLGMPSTIKPKVAKPAGKPIAKPTPMERDFDKDDWGMTDDEWRAEADLLWVKTKKDGNEHLKLFNGKAKEFTGTTNGVKYKPPLHPYTSLHTHPNWDAPLSPADMTGFMADPYEKFVGATSNKHIFIVRKTPRYTRMGFQDEADKFKKAFDKERRRLIRKTLAAQKFPDQTAISIEAGKKLAKKHGLEYKVINRKP